MSTFHSHAPIVSRETRPFVEQVKRSRPTSPGAAVHRPRGAYRWLNFEREIVWLRESQARNFLSHGGGRIESPYSTFIAMDYGVEDAKRQCEKLSVTAESSLTIAVEARIYDQPCLFEEAPRWEGYPSSYLNIPSEWRLPEKKTETYESGKSHSWHPGLEKRIVKPWQTVWSSKWEDADERWAAIMEEWKAEIEGAGDA